MKKIIGVIKTKFVSNESQESIEHFLTVIGTMANQDEKNHWYTKQSYKKAIEYTRGFLNQ